MKKLTWIMIALAALAAGAFAQTGSESLKLHLASPAMVSGMVLGAGDYTIRTEDSAGTVVLSIESETTNTHVLALANRIGVHTTPADFNRVVLVRDSNGYRIDKVWIGDEGYEILNSAK